MTKAAIGMWAIALTIALTAAQCTAQQVPKKLTNHDITQMVSLGLSEEVIVDKIRATDATDFDTSVEALEALKADKVPDNIIRAMINAHPASASNAGSAADHEASAIVDPNDPNSIQRSRDLHVR